MPWTCCWSGSSGPRPHSICIPLSIPLRELVEQKEHGARLYEAPIKLYYEAGRAEQRGRENNPALMIPIHKCVGAALVWLSFCGANLGEHIRFGAHCIIATPVYSVRPLAASPATVPYGRSSLDSRPGASCIAALPCCSVGKVATRPYLGKLTDAAAGTSGPYGTHHGGVIMWETPYRHILAHSRERCARLTWSPKAVTEPPLQVPSGGSPSLFHTCVFSACMSRAESTAA